MLSRKICIQCQGDDWFDYDDMCWRKHETVHCMPQRRTLENYFGTNVKGPAPDWCPFALEHLMEAQRC